MVQSKFGFRSSLLFALLVSLPSFAAAPSSLASDSAKTSAPDPVRATASSKEKKLSLRQAAAKASLSFVPNRRQAKKDDLFVAHSGGTWIALQQDGLEIETSRTKAEPSTASAGSEAGDGGAGAARSGWTAQASEVSRVKLQFAGANPAAKIEGLDAMVSRVNLYSRQRSQAMADQPAFLQPGEVHGLVSGN